MATIHPSPKLAYLREDGAGGMDMIFATHDGQTFVHSLRPGDAARWMAQLAEWTGQKLKSLEARG